MHIGNRIKEVFEVQPKTHNIEWFAARLNCKRANIYNIFSRQTIDTQLLYQISEILDHDFFRDLSDDMMKARGITLGEKQRVYDDMMDAMGRLFNRHLKRININDTGSSARYASDEDNLPLV